MIYIKVIITDENDEILRKAAEAVERGRERRAVYLGT